jgi:lysine 2,3-aminomutase
LADAGIPLGTQTVLLKGVNDDPAVMRALMQKLLACRVRPYYIYQADQVAGTEHLRTTVAKGLEVIKGLRGWTSGLAVPHFVIDTPGGGGKVPLLPDYVESMTDKEVVLRNYEGKAFVYKQVKTRNVPAAPPSKAPAPMEAWALKEQSSRRKEPADVTVTPSPVVR